MFLLHYISNFEKFHNDSSSAINKTTSYVTEKASNEIKPCLFPFIFGSKTYYGCTTDGIPTNVENPWCSTNVDPTDRSHVIGGDYYGNCPTTSKKEDVAKTKQVFSFFETQQFLFHPISKSKWALSTILTQTVS